MKPLRLLSILGLFLCAALTLSAQENGGWRLEVEAPEGFRDLPGSGAGRRFIHRLPELDERSRIDVSVVESTLTELGDFLESEGGADRKAATEDGEFDLGIGKAGSRTFLGRTELLGRDFRYERLVIARKLEEGRFLRIVATLYHATDEPSKELREITRRGIEEIVGSLVVEKRPAEEPTEEVTEIETEPARDDAKVETRLGRFSNDRILPFRFDYPLDWYVGYDDLEAPGLLWVLATPKDGDGFVPAEEDMRVALRVTVFGSVPELIGIEDELARACAFVTDDYRRRPGDCRIEQVGEALLGAARGRVFRFAEEAGRGDAGLVLVAVADSGLIVAEYRCRGADLAAQESAGRALLGSFEITPERGRSRIEASPFAFSMPEGFEIEEVGTEDRSRAFLVRRPGYEMFLRSFVLPEGDPPTEKAFRKLCASLFAETLGLGTPLEIEKALPLVVPDATEGLQHFVVLKERAIERRAIDLFAFVKGGAIHFAVLSSRDGLGDHARGRLLEMLCGLTGPGPLPPRVQMGDDGLLDRRVCLRFFGPRPFATDGRLVGSVRGRLILDADGSAVMDWRDPTGFFLREGSYRKVGDQLIVNLGDSMPRAFTWSAEERLATDAEGRRWYPSSGF